MKTYKILLASAAVALLSGVGSARAEMIPLDIQIPGKINEFNAFIEVDSPHSTTILKLKELIQKMVKDKYDVDVATKDLMLYKGQETIPDAVSLGAVLTPGTKFSVREKKKHLMDD